MQTSKAGVDLIKKYEGLSLTGYLCSSNVATVGYGSTGPDIYEGMVITEKEAEARLKASLSVIERGIHSLVSVPLSQNKFDALVSFAYNVGPTAFQNSTLLKLLNSGATSVTVAAEFARWNKVNKLVVPGLVARRAAERDLFLSEPLVVTATASILALQDTWLKREPKQASELAPERKLFVPKGSAHEWDKLEQVSGEGHFKVYLTRHPEQPWFFWPDHFKIINKTAPFTPVSTSFPEVLAVPYYSQRDNSTQPLRTCFSSSCAMLLKYLKPNSITGDDQYLNTVFKYGDTTEASAQIKALNHYGVKAVLRQNGTWADVNRLLRAGVPVPLGILHKGRVSAPTGTGHWIISIGLWKNFQGYWVHDPFGELDLVGGTYISSNGKSLRYSQKNLGPRWMVGGGATGWYIEALSW